jgi:hypothetical protein
MAAGLTLNNEDLKPYGTPASKARGQLSTYYPIEMLRALVGVWLFAGCRIDEIHRLELDCINWDTGTDPDTGEQFTSCLLRVPANKTSGPFTKPVDPVVGQLVDAWKLVRPTQPDLPDRKTRQPRQHLFTWRGQLIGKAYLNDRNIPALCSKANIPESDSRGALTSHLARATIATQLLNAGELRGQVTAHLGARSYRVHPGDLENPLLFFRTNALTADIVDDDRLLAAVGFIRTDRMQIVLGYGDRTIQRRCPVEWWKACSVSRSRRGSAVVPVSYPGRSPCTAGRGGYRGHHGAPG